MGSIKESGLTRATHIMQEFLQFLKQLTWLASSDVLEWWNSNGPDIPHWANVAQKVFSILN